LFADHHAIYFGGVPTIGVRGKFLWEGGRGGKNLARKNLAKKFL
jgi:hypothetical protein